MIAAGDNCSGRDCLHAPKCQVCTLCRMADFGTIPFRRVLAADLATVTRQAGRLLIGGAGRAERSSSGACRVERARAVPFIGPRLFPLVESEVDLMIDMPLQREPISEIPPLWASLSASMIRRLPLGRYRMMDWLCRGSSARFVAQFPGSSSGLRFECDVRNSLAREAFFTGKYEPPETFLIRRLVDPGGTFVDVGAHWGYFSLIMAEHVGAAGRVLAIEADPRIYAILERNFAMNDLPQVQLVYAAAAAGSGVLPLISFDEHHNNWGISRIAAGSERGSVSYEV